MAHLVGRSRAWCVVACGLLGGCIFSVDGLDAGAVADDMTTAEDLAVDDLGGPDFYGVDLYGVDLSQPDLAQPDLSQPDLSHPDLSQPDLSHPDLSQPDLSHPDLSQPDFSLPPDMADPCLPAPTLPANTIAAQCWLGGAAITVDGQLGEWSSAPTFAMDPTAGGAITTGFTGTDPQKLATLSGNFSVRWDHTTLYFAARVTDNTRVTTTTQVWKGDAVEIFVRAPASPTSGALGTSDWQFVVSAAGVVETYRNATLITTPAGFSAAVHDTGSGANWELEVAIPWSIMGVSTASIGQVSGLDVIFDDLDSGASMQQPQRTIMWKNQGGAGNCASCGGGNNNCAPYCALECEFGLQLGGR